MATFLCLPPLPPAYKTTQTASTSAPDSQTSSSSSSSSQGSARKSSRPSPGRSRRQSSSPPDRGSDNGSAAGPGRRPETTIPERDTTRQRAAADVPAIPTATGENAGNSIGQRHPLVSQWLAKVPSIVGDPFNAARTDLRSTWAGVSSFMSMGDAAPEDLPSAPAPSPRDTSAHDQCGERSAPLRVRVRIVVLVSLGGLVLGVVTTLLSTGLLSLPTFPDILAWTHTSTPQPVHGLGWLEAQATPCSLYPSRRVPSLNIRIPSADIIPDSRDFIVESHQYFRYRSKASQSLETVAEMLNSTGFCDLAEWQTLPDPNRRYTVVTSVGNLAHAAGVAERNLVAFLQASEDLATQLERCASQERKRAPNSLVEEKPAKPARLRPIGQQAIALYSGSKATCARVMSMGWALVSQDAAAQTKNQAQTAGGDSLRCQRALWAVRAQEKEGERAKVYVRLLLETARAVAW